jgi:hypothetical protein
MLTIVERILGAASEPPILVLAVVSVVAITTVAVVALKIVGKRGGK